MQHTRHLEAIRAVVVQTFAEYASPDVEFSESVLIRKGFYCGRCFTCDSVRAVWFAEENVVKFYADDGKFLVARCIDPRRGDVQTQRRAA